MTATATPTARIDNRGDNEVPFGFIYVGETRLGFSQGSTPGTLKVWEARGWRSPEIPQFKAALSALISAFPDYTVVAG